MPLRRRIAIAACVLTFVLIFVSNLIAQKLQANIPIGSNPQAVAVNSYTDRVYVIDEPSNQIMEIDGVTSATTAISLGSNSQESLNGALAIDPIANKIYAVDGVNNHLAVIDGPTRSVTMVATPAGSNAYAVAVNPYTSKVYVVNFFGESHTGSVTVVDGVTLATTTVAAGVAPISIAIDYGKNKIYVANSNSGTVTVINGKTNAVETVHAGGYPAAVAVNSATHMVYVVNTESNSVTVIDGATNATDTVEVGTYPSAVGINSQTNKIYVGSPGASGYVTIIDGKTNATTNVAVSSEENIAVDQLRNKIYVTNAAGLGVIDGKTNATYTVPIFDQTFTIAENVLTNQLYVTDLANNSVNVFSGAAGLTPVSLLNELMVAPSDLR